MFNRGLNPNSSAGLPPRCDRRCLQILRLRLTAGLLLLLPLVTGCLNPATTRMPRCFAWPTVAENQAFERHYPFSDPDVGPSTDSAPRGYDRPRSAARRAAEQKVLQGI
ncbi:MAG: hypothetical protein RLZZ458_1983, partial [Planctomycetota bacterium]